MSSDIDEEIIQHLPTRSWVSSTTVVWMPSPGSIVKRQSQTDSRCDKRASCSISDLLAEKPSGNSNLDDVCPKFMDLPKRADNYIDLGASDQLPCLVHTVKDANEVTYIGRHQGYRSGIISCCDADFRRFAKHGRDQQASQHGERATIAMPVQCLGHGNSKVDQPVGAQQPIPMVERIILVAEKVQEAIQSQRLANGEDNECKPWNDHCDQRPPKSAHAAQK